jgi:selenocysteine lyase/cysteine desulfurase
MLARKGGFHSMNQSLNLGRRHFLGTIAGAAALAPAALAAKRAAASSSEDAYWKKIRSEFHLGPNEIFLNTGTLGSTPRPVTDAVMETMKYIAELPPINSGTENKKVPEVREKVAKLLGASPKEVTVTTSTTYGLNLSILGLDWKAGDEILMSTHEHGGGIAPSQYAAKRFGVNIVKFDPPVNPKSDAEVLQAMEDKITPRTKMILVSHVFYTTGYIAPVEQMGEIARRRNILFCVDAAHTAGLMPIDVKKMNANFYSCAGHKWLCGPSGTGLLYVSEETLPMMHPLTVDRVSDKMNAEASQLNSASTAPIANILGLGAAIDFHTSIGAEKVFAHNVALINRFKRGLASIPNVDLVSSYEGRNAGPVVTVDIKGGKDCKDVVARLKKEHNVTIRTMTHKELPRIGNAIRVSAHVYNTDEDIDKGLAGLKAVMAS